MSVVISDMS